MCVCMYMLCVFIAWVVCGTDLKTMLHWHINLMVLLTVQLLISLSPVSHGFKYCSL